ncbi:MAG TPA: ribonuclease HII [Gemmatimonadales bacterium]|nr:ribonuclease HII [Gemmatimonadales bacterium]
MPAPRPTLERERAAWAAGKLLVGVDEVGRGPLAGPVVAAAVVFPAGTTPPDGIRDSKTLSARRREALAPAIRAAAFGFAFGAASTVEIDRHNIRRATALAMRRAVRRLFRVLPATDCVVLLDGLPLPELGYTHAALVDGDAHCATVAAAGIVAKTLRDALMIRLALRHPGYGWETNAGYGTSGHLAALSVHGPTRHHRTSFAPVARIVGR